jgi:antitoxin component of MazEF toxin-antitoxin module
VVLPKELVRKHKVQVDDEVTVDFDGAPTMESVRGSLAHLGLTVDEMNAQTNLGEEL